MYILQYCLRSMTIALLALICGTTAAQQTTPQIAYLRFEEGCGSSTLNEASTGYTDSREDYAESGRSMPPAVKSSRSERRMPPAVKHDDDEEESPLNAPVGRDRPLNEKRGGTVYNADVPEEQEEGADIGEVFQALVFAAGLGFGIAYAIFYFMQGQLSSAVFWGLFLGVAPALTLIFYSTLTKRIFGL